MKHKELEKEIRKHEQALIKRAKPIKGKSKAAQRAIQPTRTEENKKKKLLKQVKEYPSDSQAKRIALSKGWLR